jgi:prepilin-type N-terminal cleavage/methylation domain-containing protein
MRAKCEQGFTIIELTITLACIAVLAAIAVPKFSGYILQAHLQGAKPYLQELAAKQRNYKIENGVYCCGGNTFDEGNLSTNLGLSLANAGDFCFAFVCRDAGFCQSPVPNAFVSATTAPATTPDFEIWAVLRNTASGNVAGPGALSCVPITGKQPPTGWVQASTPATVSGRTGQVVALRYSPPQNGRDSATGNYRGITFDWLDGVSISDASLP